MPRGSQLRGGRVITTARPPALRVPRYPCGNPDARCRLHADRGLLLESVWRGILQPRKETPIPIGSVRSSPVKIVANYGT